MERPPMEDEEKTARMIRAAYPPEGRLDPHLKAGFYGRLAHRLPTRPAFPVAVLAILCAGLLGLDFAMLTIWIGGYVCPQNPLVTLLLGCIFALNLVNLPVAGLILITRRKNAKLDL